MARHILVPLDGSRLAAVAIPHAVTLSRALDAPICLLGVVAPFTERSAPPNAEVLESDERRVATGTAYLESVATALRAPDLVVRAAIRHGNPAGEILRAAESEEAALVIMSTHGRTGLARLRLGSVAQHVVRHGGTPTMVVRPQHGAVAASAATITAVTVTLDGSPLAEEALALAARLAAALAVPLTLLQVIPSLPGLGTGEWGAGYVHYYPPSPALERDEERAVAAYLETAAAPLRAPGLEVRTCWRRGPTTHAGEAIATYLAERPAELAVMASHGRGGMLRWALGSTAEDVLDRAPCPVVIVHADGA